MVTILEHANTYVIPETLTNVHMANTTHTEFEATIKNGKRYLNKEVSVIVLVTTNSINNLVGVEPPTDMDTILNSGIGEDAEVYSIVLKLKTSEIVRLKRSLEGYPVPSWFSQDFKLTVR
jgi:hypothetical protein